MHRSSLAPIAIAAASLLALTACGGDDPVTTVGPSAPITGPVGTGGTGGTGGTVPSDRGWVDGEPDWHGSSGEMELAASPEADVAMEYAEAGAESAEASGAAIDQQAAGLRAGSVDDNAAFDDYLVYLARIRELGIALRAFDPTGRVVITVTGSNGLPVAGAEVVVAAGGQPVASMRTTADGTARFLPALYGQAVDGSFTFTAGDASVDAVAGGTADISLAAAGGVEGSVPVDVLFLLDATGSMGDEIDRLKTSIDSVASRVDALAGNPDVRFGMTLYRDVDDTFVTSTFDFTADVDAFRTALADVVADGGGDYPEALDEGLADALAVPTWRDPASTVQLVFLVADAPPQVGRQVQQGYPASIADAVGRGIEIFPVASSESDDQAEAVFRQLAQATGGRFVFLSYGAAGAATGGSTDITATDYEELALDDLVVRLIAEELAALTGDASVVPTPTPAPTTVPQGQ